MQRPAAGLSSYGSEEIVILQLLDDIVKFTRREL